MSKLIKIIGAAGAVALAAGLVPYRFKNDAETGEFELGGLLWNLKKEAGDEEDTYTMELLPFIDKEVSAEEKAIDEEAEQDVQGEEAVEEPFAEQSADEVVVVESAEDAAAEDPDAVIEIEVEVDDEPVVEEAAEESEAPAEDAE